MLWHALAEEGLFPSQDEIDLSRPAIARLGKNELAWARSLSGRITWWRALFATGYILPQQIVIRILGMGQALAGFLIAPLHLDPPSYDRATRIGMLSNLIVTLYDAFLDSGRAKDNPLSPDVLLLLLDRRARRQLPDSPCKGSGPQRLMTCLIARYFEQLEALPYVHRHPMVMSTLVSAIQRMYEGQNITPHLSYGALDVRGRRALRAKSIYPIMIMGLPAWLNLPEAPTDRIRWHLRWMCRLGVFFGWVDDAVDLWLDAQLDQPNAVSARRLQIGDSLAHRAAFTRQIAAQGRRLLDEWTQEVGDLHAVPEMARTAFGVCLYSWFGGPPD